jgi:hypothetical protein
VAVDILFELYLFHTFLAVQILKDLIFGLIIRVFPDTNEQCLLPSADDVFRFETDLLFFWFVFSGFWFVIEKLLDRDGLFFIIV